MAILTLTEKGMEKLNIFVLKTLQMSHRRNFFRCYKENLQTSCSLETRQVCLPLPFLSTL